MVRCYMKDRSKLNELVRDMFLRLDGSRHSLEDGKRRRKRNDFKNINQYNECIIREINDFRRCITDAYYGFEKGVKVLYYVFYEKR